MPAPREMAKSATISDGQGPHELMEMVVVRVLGDVSVAVTHHHTPLSSSTRRSCWVPSGSPISNYAMSPASHSARSRSPGVPETGVLSNHLRIPVRSGQKACS